MESIDDFRAEDFEICDYNPHPTIKMQMAVWKIQLLVWVLNVLYRIYDHMVTVFGAEGALQNLWSLDYSFWWTEAFNYIRFLKNRVFLLL